VLPLQNPQEKPMANKHYDVLVIGGGIHGVGVAQVAAAAGYRVLVLEQGELASGTSSRSSKLIHGGLRYLEHGQFSLVRECLRERALLLKNAPGLVRLRPFLIPVYDSSVRNRWLIAAGLALYSLLGGGGRNTRFRRVPRREWAELDGLKTDGLRAVFEYQDAQTDDAALTRAVMASAQTLGALLETQATFVAASQNEKQWQIRYRQQEQEYSCTATTLVNAAGPWANDVLKCINSTMKPVQVELVQGSHLVLDGKLQRGIYYLESPRDQRPVFVMPWRLDGAPATNAILLGTTEKHFSGNPAEAQPSQQEQDYLLETYRHYFSEPPKILEAFAGLRVLPLAKEEGGAYAARQRETVLQTDSEHSPRLLTIYGGKLTAYRATAEKVLRLLQKSLPQRTPVADTCSLKLDAPT
jgi:glycerol-3-phosphate dehydrogenase